MKRIIIDANLLVLLIVGLTDRALIEKHKRTRSFESEDFDLLSNALSSYDEIVVTPHILTEASNLVSQITEPISSNLRKTLAVLIESQSEVFEASLGVTKHQSFLRLGLTDSAILNLMKNQVPLITADLDLYLEAVKTNDNTINFNYLRQERLLNI